MFDIIGDIHGCYEELLELLDKLGYTSQNGIPVHPDGRRLAFVGDGMDRGPDSLKVLELLFKLQDCGTLHYSPGNHCNKLYRYAKGNNVQQTHGLEDTIAELDALPVNERRDVLSRYRRFYEALPLYQQLDDGQLLVVHAGLPERMIGARPSAKMKTFVLYGDITGETLPDGRPVRKDWAATYEGDPWIIYGHTPVKEPRVIGHTANIDTGCVFGGQLTAMRWPELVTVSVPSRQPIQPGKFSEFPS